MHSLLLEQRLSVNPVIKIGRDGLCTAILERSLNGPFISRSYTQGEGDALPINCHGLPLDQHAVSRSAVLAPPARARCGC
jgi:hypothetical protein